MLHVDLDKAKELVSLAINEKGEDYIYDSGDGELGSCYNVHTDEEGNLTPGCLVGHALHLGGTPLASMGGLRSSVAAGGLLEKLQEDGIVSYSPQAADWLLEVQASQDDGETWGEAVEKANSFLADRT